jgi:hypothetical protein
MTAIRAADQTGSAIWPANRLGGQGLTQAGQGGYSTPEATTTSSEQRRLPGRDLSRPCL